MKILCNTTLGVILIDSQNGDFICNNYCDDKHNGNIFYYPIGSEEPINVFTIEDINICLDFMRKLSVVIATDKSSDTIVINSGEDEIYVCKERTYYKVIFNVNELGMFTIGGYMNVED